MFRKGVKKILKYYLPVFITISALGFCVVLYLIGNHENALKCVVHKDCKIISSAKKATVKIDGVVSEDSKIFEDEGNFYLMSDPHEKDHFGLRKIDRNKTDVTHPIRCYEVLFSTYLILPECSAGIFLSDISKTNGFDSQLEISDSEIKFVIPEHKIEIIFKGE